MVANTRLWLPVAPDRLRVTASHSGGSGRREDGTTVPVRRYHARNAFSFPLEGRWLMTATPAAVRNHHRYHPFTEFGVDLTKLGPDGAVWQGDHRDPRSFFGFGEKVLAAARGDVVAVHRSAGNLSPLPEESAEAFRDRKLTAMKAAIEEDFFAFSGGNYVVIRHAGEEYSSYAHLREGGVLVDPGDHVQQGQPIGYVGATGETSLVHLHFQVTDRVPDLGARSLPFSFVGVRERPFEPGLLVAALDEHGD